MTDCKICDARAAVSLGGVPLCQMHHAAVSDEIDRLRSACEPVDAMRIASAMRQPEKARALPTPEAVLAYLQRHNLTGAKAADAMYLSGARQVRKYTGGEKPRKMDGARWFCLHAHTMLPPETIAEIETAMKNDSNASITASTENDNENGKSEKIL